MAVRRRKIHDGDPVRGIAPSTVLRFPCDHLSGGGNLQGIRPQPVCRRLHRMRRRIHLVDCLIQQQEQRAVPGVVIRERLRLRPQQLIGASIGNKRRFLHGVILPVIAVYRGPDLALVLSAVHIPVDQKIDGTGFIHIQNTNPVILEVFSLVQRSRLSKSKDLRQLRGGRRHRIKAPRIDKRTGRAAVALHELHIPDDAERNQIGGIVLLQLRVQNLLHGATIVDQVDAVRPAAQPVILRAAKLDIAAVRRDGQNIIHLQHTGFRLQVRDGRHRRHQLGRGQVPVGHLCQIAVNRHLGKTGIIPLRAGFHDLADRSPASS